MAQPIRSIVVAGGGTAGWITAGLIAARHRGRRESPIGVTLIESPDTPTVGVGEGTWPTMRTTLMKLGIRETDLLRHTGATFKQGAQFIGWRTGEPGDNYYHPLTLPQGFTQGSLVPFWQDLKQQSGWSFSRALCVQEALCEAGLAPKNMRTPEYQSVVNYAYHLDAGRFTELLQKHVTEQLGVSHKLAHIDSIDSAENGDITSLITREGERLEGDLFIDCTGFASLLLKGHYRVPFVDRSDVLFADRALTAQVPYARPDEPVATHTLATATPAGWIWDIGLQHRRGVGHVYSSRHQSEAEAKRVLRAYLGESGRDIEPGSIKLPCGHRERFWQNNCVAVGLSAGFVEPLEASSLVLVELSARMISEQLPTDRAVMDIIARRFNETFRYRWDRIVDFLKLHYCLSERPEPFWRDNADPASWPESLRELLTLWRYQSPGDWDFTSNNEVFPAASYQFVLYGMGFDSGKVARSEADLAFGQRQFDITRKLVEKATEQLPSHRELLQKIDQYGLQTV